MRISIIVPTTNRKELTYTLQSITSQLLPGDEVIVCPDDTGDWGATPRTRGMKMATGDVLLFMYAPGAFAIIRSCLENDLKPHMFRMKRNGPFNDVIHTQHAIGRGNVSTQMFVVPNDKSKLGVWGRRYDGDFDFILSTLGLWGVVFWVDEVISIWRPNEMERRITL